MWLRFGITVTAADGKIPANPRFLFNAFGVRILLPGWVGLELASVMGDDDKGDPQHTLPGAVAWGGALSCISLLATTLSYLLVAVNKN